MKMRRTYSSLLRLYPRGHRVVFADEMLAVFDEAAQERMRQGWGASARFALRELAGLIIGAAREWLAKLAYSVRHSNSYIEGRGMPDRLFMRPAGVGWEAFYGGRILQGKGTGRADREQAGSMRSQRCLNAQQRFESGSSLRRLLLFVFGDSCQCTARAQMEHGSDGGRGGIAN
jgi:hypothetical protein